MSKKEYDILLERIANHLIIQTSAMDDIGLYYGKIGIVLFFAHYARYTGCSVYEDFADELGTTPTYVSNIENAKRNTRIDYIGHIADTLGVSLEQLFVERTPVVNHRIPRR